MRERARGDTIASRPRHVLVMRWKQLHPWEVAPEEGERIQSWLAALAREATDRFTLGEWRLVAGAIIAGGAAAVAVMEADTWQLVEARRIELGADSSYCRGLMAFALGPALLRAFEGIESRADIAIFRAHGLAHPRRLGMATHLGLLLGVPSLGCADTLLCGEYGGPGSGRGDWAPVTDGREVIGGAVRTRAGAKPLFVSPGYGLRVEEAVEIALRCSPCHRLPEPIRRVRLIARGGA